MKVYKSEITLTEEDNYEKIASFIEAEISALFAENKEKQFYLKVATFEAFNNGFEHGAFPVTLTIKLLRDRLLIRIKDNGKGFQAHDKLSLIKEKGTEHLLDECKYEIRGRGIYMMYEMVDRVYYNKAGNDVLLVHFFNKNDALQNPAS